MKGLLLSSYYTSKNHYSHISSLLWPQLLCLVFQSNHDMLLAMIFLISPVTDNIKHEKIHAGCTMFRLYLQVEQLMLKVILSTMEYLS